MFVKQSTTVLLAISAVGFSLTPSLAQQVDYNRDIKPILADNCYACHGPDSSQRETDLRLDVEASAREDLGGYAAIVPGKPQDSELIRRVFAENDDVMPPSDHRKKLTRNEKQLLKKWVEQGASYDEHWAFKPVRKQPAPSFDSTALANEIDAWIVGKLRSMQIQPSQPADDFTLIRRLYLDLIGLPPSPEEVREFVNDRSADRYERLVDRLLASPHFGERMAVYWLDLVRYADTVGYHGDQDISVSPYRDYVIDAFNHNMPFDQFTREQIAGDLIPNAGLQQRIASGYNRLGMMSAEGGVQPKEYLAKYAADRVRTTASVWLGVTLGCAECHDHKFDPFSTREFYQFAAFFADIKERGLYDGANVTGRWGPQIDVPEPWLPEKLKPVEAEIAELKDQLQLDSKKLIGEFENWLANVSIEPTQWKPMGIQSVKARHKVNFKNENDVVVVSGTNHDKNTYILSSKPMGGSVTGLRLTALPHQSLPKNGPGRAGNGNFVVSEIRVFRLDSDGKRHKVPLGHASATFEQSYGGNTNPYGKWTAQSAIDGNAKGDRWGWAVLPNVGKAESLVVQLAVPVILKAGESLEIEVEQNHGAGSHTLGSFRFDITGSSYPIVASDETRFPKQVFEILSKDRNRLSADDRKQLFEHYKSFAPELARIREKIKLAESRKAKVIKDNTRTTLVTVSIKARTMRVLPRGNWMDDSGEVVSPGTPEVLSPNTKVMANRLDLANWIISKNNPLTARVFANRIWKLLFGAGLSKTLDDLGAQGEMPTHPELLDMLASDFMESGWDVKQLIKRIVMSRTYQQSSMPREELVVVDPNNRLLARQSRFRIDAEFVRDNALAVSGLLVRKIGGRSVKPYQPAGLYRHLNFPMRTYQADTGDSQFRRGVYTHWQRQFLHPAMKTLDAPSREECTAERPRSNTPLAALLLLNDPSYVETARKLAERTILSGSDHESDPEKKTIEQLKSMMFRALGRDANDEEIKVLHQLLHSHLQHFANHPKQAEALVNIGVSKSNPAISAKKLAAWTSVARAIMNMHEFIARN